MLKNGAGDSKTSSSRDLRLCRRSRDLDLDLRLDLDLDRRLCRLDSDDLFEFFKKVSKLHYFSVQFSV